jgi:hypothetical protein
VLSWSVDRQSGYVPAWARQWIATGTGASGTSAWRSVAVSGVVTDGPNAAGVVNVTSSGRGLIPANDERAQSW